MTIATTQSERLALIKKIADRRNKMAKVKSKSRKVRDYSVSSTSTKKDNGLAIPKETHNIYQWTDASKYAAEYYGETLHYTTKFDNDWD
jgi:hypothetical protein